MFSSSLYSPARILSKRMKSCPALRRGFVLAIFLCLLTIQFSFGWGSRAHKMINQIAFEMLPPGLPAFMRDGKTLEEMEYLGPEPDRWRSSAEPELSEAQAPEHFIDLELAGIAAPGGLPVGRFEFIRDLERARRKHPRLAEKLTPEKVGLLPWQANEMFERLTVDMREYRFRLDTHRPTYGVQQAILYDAGILGHYVGDGSQPLHTTINYNGWVEKDNPESFTREHHIHSQFETEFVDANIRAEDIRPLVPATPRLLHSPFQDFVAYLRASNEQVPELYRLAKDGGFEGSGTALSRRFTAERIAAGAAMLRDMIYTAWLDSAQPASSGRDRFAPHPDSLY